MPFYVIIYLIQGCSQHSTFNRLSDSDHLAVLQVSNIEVDWFTLEFVECLVRLMQTVKGSLAGGPDTASVFDAL